MRRPPLVLLLLLSQLCFAFFTRLSYQAAWSIPDCPPRGRRPLLIVSTFSTSVFSSDQSAPPSPSPPPPLLAMSHDLQETFSKTDVEKGNDVVIRQHGDIDGSATAGESLHRGL